MEGAEPSEVLLTDAAGVASNIAADGIMQAVGASFRCTGSIEVLAACPIQLDD